MESSTTNSIKTNKLISLILHYFCNAQNLFQKVMKDEFKVSIHYKYRNEKFTEADWILQKMFENYLNKYFPKINIIGEEDTSNDLIKESEFFSVKDNFDLDVVKESDIPENFQELNQEDLRLYIDPIDSTDQFIKRNFEPVTSIVGITHKDQAFIGLVYFPNYEGKPDNSLVFLNIPTRGIFSYNTNNGELQSVNIVKNLLSNWNFISSGTKTNDKMRSVFALFSNSTAISAHGLGNKAFLCVINDYVYLASGSNLGFWDVCGGHALAKEVGGGVYYVDGTELTYPNDFSSRFLKNVCIITNNSERVKLFVDEFRNSNIDLTKK